MIEADEFFITPHAIGQFQKWIARLGDEQARQVIRAGVSQAANVRVLPDGETLRERTVKPFPYEFRAYCVFDHERGHRVVTTIVWGDSRATRKRRAFARLNSMAASVANECSPVFQRRDQKAIKDPRRIATTERRIQPSRRDAT
ncbi:MAG TPA: hypothetical protein VMS31_13175 [Pyrinomonadaceae bacterium]|nr:hypothetical protein [Pyrinomonadaceae bacterium]